MSKSRLVTLPDGSFRMVTPLNSKPKAAESFTPGDVVKFTHAGRKTWIGVVIRRKRIEQQTHYHVKAYAPDPRPYVPADADTLQRPGQLYTALPGKNLISVHPQMIYLATPAQRVNLSAVKKPTKKSTTAKPARKRTMTPAGAAYLKKVDALTEKIHKASDTGETKKVKVYSISWASAKRQAVRKLKK